MSNKFIKNFKIEKALGELRPVIEKGDRLNMFGCSYTVLNNDNIITLMIDEVGTKLALPSNKLQLLLKGGYIRKLNFLAKSAVSGRLRQDALPVGTVRPDPKGGFRKKTSMQPSTWVHLTHGTHHGDTESPATHPHAIDPKERKQYNKVLDKIHEAHSEDQEKIKGMFHDYLKYSKAYEGLTRAHSLPDTDAKGNKVSFSGKDSSKLSSDSPKVRQHIEEFNTKARAAKFEFVQALRNSIERNKKGK